MAGCLEIGRGNTGGTFGVCGGPAAYSDMISGAYVRTHRCTLGPESYPMGRRPGGGRKGHEQDITFLPGILILPGGAALAALGQLTEAAGAGNGRI